MRILVACEFSGRVREAFAVRGHDAWSCDLLPSEQPSTKHIVGDVATMLTAQWDLLIAHPPCTYLCNSGVRWLVPKTGLDRKRLALMSAACNFFAALYHAPIPKAVIENPVMHGYARRQLEQWSVPAFTQSIQPWQFGEPEIKRTCLWLRGVAPLVSTNVVEGRAPRCHFASPSPERWKARSRTLQGIADAMAAQWG